MPVVLAPAATLPDITLPDHAGNPRRLGALAAGDPLVLIFYRGFWCPREREFLRRLRPLHAEAELAFTQLVSISVDPPPVVAAFRAGLGARWTFLSDENRTYQNLLGLRERSDTLYRPYPPTVLTLYPDLTIHSVYHGYWYWGRPTNDQLRTDLWTITRAIRPDWDSAAVRGL
jgi:peroxiredoxin